jgi:hypothetical protein
MKEQIIQQLEKQLRFALEKKERRDEDSREWYGYIQGLKFAIVQIEKAYNAAK